MQNSEADLVFACWVYDKNRYTIALAGGSVDWSVIIGSIGSIPGQGTYGRHLFNVKKISKKPKLRGFKKKKKDTI